MPTYEYRCPKGHQFERFQKITDPPESECPECGGRAERILSGGAGLLFKGAGFYITDYRDKSYKDRAASEAKEPSAPGESEGARRKADAAGGAGKKDGGASPSGSKGTPGGDG